MIEYSYHQFSKNVVRHNALSYAINILTFKREKSPCVKRDYVRNLYNFFTMTEDESTIKNECEKIDSKYILEWERLHDSCIGVKRPSDLIVCYLCGPEPDNDFSELTSLGILPRNIWAFEFDQNLYKAAISSYKMGDFNQPKILRQKIETFFEQSPQKFDIIYIDACGSIPSEQHALRCLSTIFKNHRLQSPGVIITNFAEPDIKHDYIELIAQYSISKKNVNYRYTDNNTQLDFKEYRTLLKNIEENFEKEYGEFISSVIRDISGIYVPMQRIYDNPYLEQIVSRSSFNYEIKEELVHECSNLSVAKFILNYYYMKNNGYSNDKIKSFIKEIELKDHLIEKSMLLLYAFRSLKCEFKNNIKEIMSSISSNLFQFLDKTDSSILFDIVTNQLAYPFHTNTKAVKRYRYRAKKTNMYTDISIFDECRYIYDWLPALHQIQSSFENPSWQYIFRFALDGLIKNRYNYNNEFFYKGTVISPSEDGFNNITMTKREIVK